jgi:hypothetical protein
VRLSRKSRLRSEVQRNPVAQTRYVVWSGSILCCGKRRDGVSDGYLPIMMFRRRRERRPALRAQHRYRATLEKRIPFQLSEVV